MRLLLLLLLLTVTVAADAGDPPRLEVSVPPEPVRVGDPVPVRITTRCDSSWQWGELQVSEGSTWAVVEPPRRDLASIEAPAWQVTLAPLETGEQPLPRLQVSARQVGGREVTISPGEPVVQVVSVLAGDEQPAPAPLRAPVGVVGLPWEWLPPLLLVLAPLATVGFWLRRSLPERSPRSAVPFTPLGELETLVALLQQRIASEAPEAICDQLAAGLRRYLEHRTSEPAGEMTSGELLTLARRDLWPLEVRRQLHRVLAVADQVRFARSPTDEEELCSAIITAGALCHELEAHLAAVAEAESFPGAKVA